MHPSRHPSCIDTRHVFGFILNVPSEYKIGFVSLPLRRRHWIALRKINDQFWNLDSKLSQPRSVGDVCTAFEYIDRVRIILNNCFSPAQDEEMITFLNAELTNKDKELFIIVASDIERQQKWLRSSENIVANVNNTEQQPAATTKS